MHFLNRKLKRDILRNWTQFFSVFLMALSSIVAYIGLEGVWYGLESNVNTFVEENHLADSWVHALGFTEEDMDSIRNISGVEDISVKTSIQVSASISDVDTYLLLETPGNENISIPFIAQGEDVSSDLIGIWINLEYAEEHQLSLGDIINVNYLGLDAELEVLGMIQSPARMSFVPPGAVRPDPQILGYGIISEHTLEEVLQHNELPNLIEIRGAENQVRDAAPELLGERYISYFNQDTFYDVASAISRANTLRNVALLFSSIFILLAILAMYTTIKRLVETQTKDIATLKALGYSNKMIGFHYASYGLWIGGVGALLGALGAPLLSLFVLETQAELFSVPNLGIAYTWTSLIMILMIIGICTISAFLASRKVRIGLPALFLRGDSVKSGRKVFLEKISILWDKLTFGSRWTFRDGMVNPIRILMGIVGVSGSMVLLLTGFGMADSLDALVENSFGIDMTYTARIRVNPFNTPIENNELQDELDGQWIQTLQANIISADEENRVLTIFDDGEFIQLRTLEDENMQQDGVYLAEGFARATGLQVGDILGIRVSLDRNEYEFEIVGIITPSTPQGIHITARAWESAGGTFRPQELLIGENVVINELASDTRVEQITLMENQRDNAVDFVESLGGVVRLIIVMGIILVIVILYNLGALNFTERRRDYATLRVLGFHRKEIRKLAMIENLITTLVGWLAGIPLGLWFLEQYIDEFSLENHIIFYPYINVMSVVIASAIAIGFSLTTTFLLGRRIKKLDVVEATKGVE